MLHGAFARLLAGSMLLAGCATPASVTPASGFQTLGAARTDELSGAGWIDDQGAKVTFVFSAPLDQPDATGRLQVHDLKTGQRYTSAAIYTATLLARQLHVDGILSGELTDGRYFMLTVYDGAQSNSADRFDFVVSDDAGYFYQAAGVVQGGNVRYPTGF